MHEVTAALADHLREQGLITGGREDKHHRWLEYPSNIIGVEADSSSSRGAGRIAVSVLDICLTGVKGGCGVSLALSSQRISFAVVLESKTHVSRFMKTLHPLDPSERGILSRESDGAQRSLSFFHSHCRLTAVRFWNRRKPLLKNGYMQQFSSAVPCGAAARSRSKG